MANLAFDVWRVLGKDDLSVVVLPYGHTYLKTSYELFDMARGGKKTLGWLKRQGAYSLFYDCDSLQSFGFSNLGKKSIGDSQYEAGIRYLQAALALNQKNAEAYAFLGHALVKMGKPNEAIEILNEGARINQGHPFLCFMLHEAHKDAGNEQKAKLYGLALPLVSRKKQHLGIVLYPTLLLMAGFLANGLYTRVQEKIGSAEEQLRSARDSIPTLNTLAYSADKVAKGFRSEYGVDYLSRYSPGVIEDMLSKRDESRPLAIVFYPKSDWNGAFYYNQLDEIHRAGCQVIAVESGYVDAFKQHIAEIERKGLKASLVVIGGHGSWNAIQLGDMDYLTKGESRPFAALRRILEPGARLVLESCSTAGNGDDNIAREISAVTGARVYGPDSNTSIDGFTFSGSGRSVALENVNYTGAKTKVYMNGALVSISD